MTNAGFLDLPSRPGKPRTVGLSHVLDKGIGVQTARALLDSAAEFIDLWKFGWGTAYVDRGLRAKLELLAEHQVEACLGGTLLELAWWQGKAAECLAWAADAGFPRVEVSRGTVEMTLTEKSELIAQAAKRFTVLSEIGFKDPAGQLVPAQWSLEARADVQAGASLVVAEGRESGTVGIYRESGAIRNDIIDALVSTVGTGSVLFEAPRRAQQAWFIRHLGPDVNLGNIALEDAVSVETLRLGLRSDTMRLYHREAGACRAVR